jgi:hypothetical protein
MATAAAVTRNAAVDAVTALHNSGKIKLHASNHAVVATLTFGATAFAGASTGSAAANAITADSNAAGGTVDHAHLTKSDDTVTLDLSCGVGSGEVQLTSLTVGAGDTVSMSAGTISIAAS